MDNQRKLPWNLIPNHKVLFSVLSIQLLSPIFLAWKHFCYSDRPTNQNQPWLVILFSVISFSLRWIKRHFWNFWRIRFAKPFSRLYFGERFSFEEKDFGESTISYSSVRIKHQSKIRHPWRISSLIDFLPKLEKSLLVEKTNMFFNRSWTPHRPRIRPRQPGIHGSVFQATWPSQK